MRLKNHLRLMHYSKTDVMCTRIQALGKSIFFLCTYLTHILRAYKSRFIRPKAYEIFYFLFNTKDWLLEIKPLLGL